MKDGWVGTPDALGTDRDNVNVFWNGKAVWTEAVRSNWLKMAIFTLHSNTDTPLHYKTQ